MDIPRFSRSSCKDTARLNCKSTGALLRQLVVLIPPTIAIHASRQPVTRDLCDTHIDTFVPVGGHHVERHHSSWPYILIASISGSGSCKLAAREWNLAVGDLLFQSLREDTVYRSGEQFPWTIFLMRFPSVLATQVNRIIGGENSSLIQHANNRCPLPVTGIALASFDGVCETGWRSIGWN